MTMSSQKKASDTQRRAKTTGGLTRIEVQASKRDAGLIRSLAQTLRSDDARAKALRSALEQALIDPDIETAFDVFGSDLPDDAFAGVFDLPRPKGWREVDL